MIKDIRVGRGGTFLSRAPVASNPSIALRQQAVGTTADGSGGFGVTLGSEPVAGNSLIAEVSYISTITISSEIGTDDQIFTLAASKTVAGVTTDIWYLHAITGGTSSQSIGGLTSLLGRVSLNVSEWSGLASQQPRFATNSGIASATVTTGTTAVPATAANLAIAIGGWTANDYSSGPTNGFTRMTPTGGGAAWQEEAYLIQSSADAASTGWGLTAGINWAAVIAVFNDNS